MSSFINFTAPSPLYSGDSRNLTTMALNEEGGAPPDDMITSAALSEEGGGYTPPPSDGTVTTLALNEEGGYPGEPPLPVDDASRRTSDYLRVAQEADLDRNGLTQPELQNQINTYQQQLQFIDSFKNYFPWVRPYLEALENRINSDLKVANRLNKHFGQVDSTGSQDGRVTFSEIVNTAQRDGNGSDLSDQDLGTISPLPLPQAATDRTEIYLSAARQADKNQDGLTRGELALQAQTYQANIQELQQLIAQPNRPAEELKHLQERLADLKNHLYAANRMLRHFHAFDFFGNRDGKIAYQEILATAQRDGDSKTISPNDLYYYYYY